MTLSKYPGIKRVKVFGRSLAGLAFVRQCMIKELIILYYKGIDYLHYVKNEDIETIGKLVAEGFADDPKNEYQLRNIQRKEFVLKTQAENQLREFMEKGDVYALDNNKGLVIGYDSRKLDFNDFIKILTVCSNELKEIMTEHEMQTIISNSRILGAVDNPFWFHGMFSEYYYLVVIVIDKQIRGSGAFRELISPVLRESDMEKIPIIIETHKKSNVDIYKHFGFEVIKEFSDEKVEFRQYCMIRQPGII